MERHAETEAEQFSRLVSEVLSGSPSAKEDLARKCLRRARRTVFLSTGGDQDTDDIVQKALLKLFKSLSTFRNESKFTTWFDSITYNTIRDHFRRKKVTSLFKSEERIDLAPDHCSAPADHLVDMTAAAQELVVHLEKIALKKRVAFVLHTAHGYTAQDIAQIVGCSPDAAKKRVSHGRKELLARLQKDPKLLRTLQEVLQ